MEKFIGKRVVARSIDAGVFYGTLLEKDGGECLMGNVRCLHAWRRGSARSLNEIANGNNTVSSDNSRFTDYVDELLIGNVVEIIPCTNDGIRKIEAVIPWKL